MAHTLGFSREARLSLSATLMRSALIQSGLLENASRTAPFSGTVITLSHVRDRLAREHFHCRLPLMGRDGP
jgi:hypothetical protein